MKFGSEKASIGKTFLYENWHVNAFFKFFFNERHTSHVHPNDHEPESFTLQVTVGTGSRNEIQFTLLILVFHVVQLQFGSRILQHCV
jgi:hypothetical protein